MMGYMRLCDMCTVAKAVIFNQRNDAAHCERCYPTHLEHRKAGMYLDRVPTYKAPEVWVIRAAYKLGSSESIVDILDYQPTPEEVWAIGMRFVGGSEDFTFKTTKHEVKRRLV